MIRRYMKQMKHLIEKVFNFDDHRTSEHPNSLSVSTLIGAEYKASQKLKGKPKKDINVMLKRSSTIGTGFHMRAEQVLRNDPNTIAIEQYNERLTNENVWISGTFDLLYKGDDGENHLCDWKTSYGKEFNGEKLLKAKLQMSIYRWLNYKDYDISDKAYVLFVSQSNNAYESYEIELMPIDEVIIWINNKLRAIQQDSVPVDCKEGIKYNPCDYCDVACDYLNPSAKEFS